MLWIRLEWLNKAPTVQKSTPESPGLITSRPKTWRRHTKRSHSHINRAKKRVAAPNSCPSQCPGYQISFEQCRKHLKWINDALYVNIFDTRRCIVYSATEVTQLRLRWAGSTRMKSKRFSKIAASDHIFLLLTGLGPSALDFRYNICSQEERSEHLQCSWWLYLYNREMVYKCQYMSSSMCWKSRCILEIGNRRFLRLGGWLFMPIRYKCHFVSDLKFYSSICITQPI